MLDVRWRLSCTVVEILPGLSEHKQNAEVMIYGSDAERTYHPGSQEDYRLSTIPHERASSLH